MSAVIMTSGHSVAHNPSRRFLGTLEEEIDCTIWFVMNENFLDNGWE